jgi:hypothetical protein
LEENDGRRKRARDEASDEAEEHRYRIHRAIAERNVDAMRKAINALYHFELQANRGESATRTSVVYAPTVEACILAHIFAPGTKLADELSTNFENLHEAFEVPHEDYLSIRAQLDEMEGEEGNVAEKMEWCSGTCMHGLVRPFRYKDIFPAAASSV